MLDQATEDIVSGQCLNGDAGQLQPGQKAVLKVSAVTYGVFNANEYKVLRDIKQIAKGIYPQKGDLLFSRANTREYVGATALIDRDYPDLMLPDKLWKLIFKQEIMPVFAKQFLSHPEVRKVLSAMATGTSGSMYNISMEKLKRLEIIVPNMNRQKEYIRFVEQSDKSKLLISRLIAWKGGVIMSDVGRKASMPQVLADIKPYITKKFMAAPRIKEQDIQAICQILLPRYKNVQLMQGLTNNKPDFRIQVKSLFGTEEKRFEVVGGDKKRPATKKKSDLGWIDQLEEIDAALDDF